MKTLLIALALLASNCYALDINVWQISHHLGKAPEGREFNEVNPGIGVRKYLTENTFLTADYIYKNSTGGRLLAAGVGTQRRLAEVEGLELLAGAAVGLSNYENAWEKKSYLSVNGYPFIAARMSGVTATLGGIPKITWRGSTTYPAVFLYLSFNIK